MAIFTSTSKYWLLAIISRQYIIKSCKKYAFLYFLICRPETISVFCEPQIPLPRSEFQLQRLLSMNTFIADAIFPGIADDTRDSIIPIK